MKQEIRISIKAVLIGGLVDLLSTNLLLNFLAAYVVIDNGFPQDKIIEFAPQINNIIHNNSILFSIQTLFGLLGSILGGYITARIAGEDEVQNAIAASLLMVGINLYAILVGETDSILLEVFGIVVTPVFYRLGALIRVRQKAPGK